MGFDTKDLVLKGSPPINHLRVLGQVSSSVTPEHYYPQQELLQGLNETKYVKPLRLAGSFSTSSLPHIHIVPGPG